MAVARPPTTICPGETNMPTTGLRYRVVISTTRVLDSAVVETTFDNIDIDTGTVPSSACPPFQLCSCMAVPQETCMVDTTVTPMNCAPNYARVKADVVIPLILHLTDAKGMAIKTHTTFTYPEDVVLYVPDAADHIASFPYEITSEGIAAATEGIGDRTAIKIKKLCIRIITRVGAQTDMLIPAYGFAPVNPAIPYTNEICRDFFTAPLFPNGRDRTPCPQG